MRDALSFWEGIVCGVLLGGALMLGAGWLVERRGRRR